MDYNHFSLIDPVDAATVFGVTGVLLALIVKFDVLSLEPFYLTWAVLEILHDEQLPFDLHCLGHP